MELTLTAIKMPNGDVRLFNGIESRGIYRSWLSNKPTKRNKYVMYNCSRYRLQWSE